MQEVREKNYLKFSTLATNVTRLKTQLSNKSESERIINYVHVDDMHSCYIFSMFYHLVMEDNTKSASDYVYSNWVDYIIKVDDGKVVIDNRLSKPFQNTWKYLKGVANQHLTDSSCDEGLVDVCLEFFFNKFVAEKVTGKAHGGKNSGIELLGDSDIAPQHISARAGWMMKSFHTFFDYWHGSLQSIKKSGKIMAGWISDGTDTEYTAGSPPTMSDTKLSPAEMNTFVNAMIGHVDLEIGVKELLVAVGLLFYDQFVDHLHKHPKKLYDGKERLHQHLFIHKVRCYC